MFKDLVEKNRSYRGFDENVKVDEQELKDLVELTRYVASGGNQQPLKYRLICEKQEVAVMNSLTRWGKMLPDIQLPHPGQYPSAYILVVVDTDICPNPTAAGTDIGIAAQTMLLGAVEKGLGGGMIANFDKNAAAKSFCIGSNYAPVLAVAIGKPVETVKIVDVEDDGSTKYYRDADDIHYVPKRKLNDLLV